MTLASIEWRKWYNKFLPKQIERNVCYMCLLDTWLCDNGHRFRRLCRTWLIFGM